MGREESIKYYNPVEGSGQGLPKKTIGTRIFAMYEGRRTEPEYFENLIKEHSELNGTLSLINLKCPFETDLTDRLQMVRSANAEYDYRMGKMSLFKAVTLVFDDFYNSVVQSQTFFPDRLKEILQKRRKEYCDRKDLFGKHIMDSNGILLDHKRFLEMVHKLIQQICEDEGIDFKYSFNKLNLLNPSPECSIYVDCYYVVFDRDYWCPEDKPYLSNSHKKAQSNECYIQCKNESNPSIELLLTTPFFEYWLLLHIPDYNYWEIKPDLSSKASVFKAILEYERDPEFLKNSEEWDDDCLIKYYESHYKGMPRNRYNTYYNGSSLKRALEHSDDHRLAREYMELLNRTGTTLAEAIRSLFCI